MSFNRWLGLHAASDIHEVALETRPEHEVVPGTIHFAVLATLGEVAAAAAVEAGVVPVAVHAQLVTRARPGRLTARGELVRRGGRLAFARGEVAQDGKVVATVDVTFALV